VFLSLLIFLNPVIRKTYGTKFGPLIRDSIRLFVIRYGDTKRDTIFDPLDTPLLGNTGKALRHGRLSQLPVNLNP
jgi:hypothetical protein